jgi:hypothetical protein
MTYELRWQIFCSARREEGAMRDIVTDEQRRRTENMAVNS